MKWCLWDFDDTIVKTTPDMRGDHKRHRHLTLVPGALKLLKKNRRCNILVTAGNEVQQRQKIGAVKVSKFFRQKHFVPDPQDKPQKLEEIVKYLTRGLWGCKSHEIVIIGDRLDTEIRKGNELGCITVRIRIPGGKHSDEMARGSLNEVPHFEAKDFEELMNNFAYFAV